MSDRWAVLGVLAALVLPMALAWWLPGRSRHTRTPRAHRHGKMPGEEDR